MADIGDQWVITSWLVDQLFKRLQMLVSQYPNTRLVDSRNALPNRRQWENQIHPVRRGFELIAKKLRVPQLGGPLK